MELAKYASVIESFALKNLLLPIHLMYKQFCLAHTVKMSYPSFCKYLGQISALPIINASQKLIQERVTGDGAVQILRLLGSQSNVPVLCDQLLEHSTKFTPKPDKACKPPISMKRQNLCLLVHYLVGKGMNMQTIGMILNVSKATVSNLWYETSNLQSMILNSIGKWSGKISIDEKFIRIEGIPHYVITIVDFVTKLPLYLNLYKNTRKESYEACFRAFKLIYRKSPTMIVSDGSKSLAAGRKAVFPKVPHQLCKFHKIRNLFKKITLSARSFDEMVKLKAKVVTVFRRDSVSGRKKGLIELQSLAPKPAAEYISRNIIMQWRQLSKGYTSNVSERFNRKIHKVMSGRYGLKSEQTALNLALSLWLTELIDKGKPFLHDESRIATLNIAQLCQENVDWAHLDHLFSKKVRRVA